MKKHPHLTALGLALAVVVGLTGVAYAAQSLTTSVAPSTLYYPHKTKVTVAAAEALAETITVWYRYETTVTPFVLRSIPASCADDATSFAVPFRPSQNAWVWSEQGAVKSAEVSVSVKAALYGPRMPSTIKLPFKGKKTAVRGIGLIKPRHANGSKAVLVTVYYRPNAASSWVETGTVEGTIIGRAPEGSHWRMSWTPTVAGYYKFIATHEDAAHVKSTARPKVVRVVVAKAPKGFKGIRR